MHRKMLKETSAVGVIVDKVKDYSIVNGVQYFIPTFFSAKLGVSICKMSEVIS